jgi:hypothetical protein
LASAIAEANLAASDYGRDAVGVGTAGIRPRRQATATASAADTAPIREHNADSFCWISRSAIPSVIASSAADFPSDNDRNTDRSQGVM